MNLLLLHSLILGVFGHLLKASWLLSRDLLLHFLHFLLGLVTSEICSLHLRLNPAVDSHGISLLE
jgi:hypothetical protein